MDVELWVGTRKGAFLLRSDERRRKWTAKGPFFPGQEVAHAVKDPRTGKVWAATKSAWFGAGLQFSANDGRTWTRAKPLKFETRGLKLERIWNIAPDRPSRPNVLWCGVDPGGLFRSDDGGKSWREVTSLTRHPTRKKWGPGAGGMCTHTIIPDPHRPWRLYVAISAAGVFRSDDDGKSWEPKNGGVRADFMPNKFPEVGQCVHKLVLSPWDPDTLFQQNHCGIYRSEAAGDGRWTDISRGTPTRFGFPVVMHPHEARTIFVVPQIGDESRFFPGAALAVWRSRDGGGSWRKFTAGLPRPAYGGVLRHAACADRCAEAGLYVGTTNGEIFHSRDEGRRWELLRSRLPSVLSLEAGA